MPNAQTEKALDEITSWARGFAAGGNPTSTTGGCGVDPVPLSMEADLNTGTVTLKGAFPEIASTLKFGLEYLERFTDDAGKNIAFYSKADKSNDKAGYITVFSLIGA